MNQFLKKLIYLGITAAMLSCLGFGTTAFASCADVQTTDGVCNNRDDGSYWISHDEGGSTHYNAEGDMTTKTDADGYTEFYNPDGSMYAKEDDDGPIDCPDCVEWQGGAEEGTEDEEEGEPENPEENDESETDDDTEGEGEEEEEAESENPEEEAGEETTEGEEGEGTIGEAAGGGADGQTTDTETTDGDEDKDSSSVKYDTGKESLGSFSVTQYLTIPGTTTDEEGTSTNIQEQRYLKQDNVSPIIGFILTIIDFLAKVVGTFAVILIIIGGLLLLSSEGDDNKIQKGKGIILQAIIGLIIALASYIIVTFVQSLLYVTG